MMMRMRIKMRRSRRITTTTRRRTMTKLSNVIPFQNHKIETWGCYEDLNMMFRMRRSMRSRRTTRKTRRTTRRTRRTTRRRTIRSRTMTKL